MFGLSFNPFAYARTILMVAGAMSLALLVGEVHGHSRGVADRAAQDLQAYTQLVEANAHLAVQDAVRETAIAQQVHVAQLEVHHVADTYIPAPDMPAVPLPDPGYTRGFVCLWNVPIYASRGGSGTPDATACADAPQAQYLSAVTRDDLLANELDNMGKCARAYERVATLQAAIRNAETTDDQHPHQ